jgi:putative tricarboxylic transport membrane protein
MQNRLSGLVVFILGLVIIFILVPLETETVDYGWLRPATLPAIAAVVISVGGLLHLFFPKGTVELDLRSALKALLFLIIAIVALWGMSRFGFIIASPLMMLVIMLAIGERRWPWLVTGVVLLPALIWFCIDFLLKRPLP